MVTQDEDVGQGKKDNQLMIISESECWILSLLDISVNCYPPKDVCSSYIIHKIKPEDILLRYSDVLQSYITFCQNFNGKYKKKWILGNI